MPTPAYELNWHNFDFKLFERLVLNLAQIWRPDRKFELYLKTGAFQDGIDIISKYNSGESEILIQCKRDQLTLAEIKKLIAEFLKGQFAQPGNTFILATSGELSSKPIDNYLRKEKKRLKNEYKIEFIWWSKHNLDIDLQNSYQLVAYYFGNEEAERFCLKPPCRMKKAGIGPPENYIPRFVHRQENRIERMNRVLAGLTPKYYDLADLINKGRMDTHRILLVGDPYQGKTAVLSKTISILTTEQYGWYPMMLIVKNLAGKSINEYLDNYYHNWRAVPVKDLILFIDGLDEVVTHNLFDVIGLIDMFVNRNPSISIVISCRSFLVGHRDLKFDDFQTYELTAIFQEQIDQYLHQRPGMNTEDFKKRISSAILALCTNPFYLIQLADDYIEDPQELPSSKVEIIHKFFEKAVRESLKRFYDNTRKIGDYSKLFEKAIQKLAIVLQLKEANALSYADIQNFLNEKEIELLKHCPFVDVQDEYWSFSTAMFQEYLVGKFLTRFPIDKIRSLCFTKGKYRKLKTKWLQCLVNCIAFLDADNEVRKQLIADIEADNIELLFKTEHHQFPISFKKQVYAKMWKDVIERGFIPTMYFHEEIGGFAASIPGIFDEQLEHLKDEKLKTNAKVFLCRIMRFANPELVQKSKLADIVVSQCRIATDKRYPAELIELLNVHLAAGPEIIKKLIPYHEQNLLYRSAIYDLIVRLNVVEEYYEYALMGIEIASKIPRVDQHVSSLNNLQDMLLATNSRSNLSKLLEYIGKPAIAESIAYDEIITSDFRERIFSKYAQLFQEDHTVIMDIAGYIRQGKLIFDRDNIGDLYGFLDETGAHDLLLRALIDDVLTTMTWQLVPFLTNQSYDYLLFEFEHAAENNPRLAGKIPPERLFVFLSAVRQRKNDTETEYFEKICFAVSEGKGPYLSENDLNRRRLEAEERKRLNDRKIVKSPSVFLKMYNKYYEEKAKVKSLENTRDFWAYVRRFDSEFAREYEMYLRRSRIAPTGEFANKWLRKTENFEYFVAMAIMESNSLRQDVNCQEILQTYYKNKIEGVDLANAYRDEDGYIKVNQRLRLIGEIFEKFQFDTPEEGLLKLIWLDTAGINSLKDNGGERRETISSIVIRNMKGSHTLLKQQVLANFQFGIKCKPVFANHAELCRYFKIRQASPFIFSRIDPDTDDDNFNCGMIDIYLEITGDFASLEAVYKSIVNYNIYTFSYLTRILYERSPELITSVGKLVLQSDNADAKTKINIAKYMLISGSLDTLEYLLLYMRDTKRPCYESPSSFKASKIETRSGLEILSLYREMLVDPEYRNELRWYDSASGVFKQWIYDLAGKSIEDMELVVGWLQQIDSQYPNKGEINHLFDHMIDHILEISRDKSEVYRNAQIMDILNQLVVD